MKIWTKTKKLNLISTKFEPWIYGCFCTEIWYDANETKWFSGEKTEENIRTANDGEVRWGPMNDQKRVQLREKKRCQKRTLQISQVPFNQMLY